MWDIKSILFIEVDNTLFEYKIIQKNKKYNQDYNKRESTLCEFCKYRPSQILK